MYDVFNRALIGGGRGAIEPTQKSERGATPTFFARGMRREHGATWNNNQSGFFFMHASRRSVQPTPFWHGKGSFGMVLVSTNSREGSPPRPDKACLLG